MAIVTNPTIGEEIKDLKFNPFVDKVIQFLYDNHCADFCKLIKKTKTNLEIDYGPARIISAFYNSLTGKHVPWPRPYTFASVKGVFYLCMDWNGLTPRPGDNRDYYHLKEMISIIFPMYEVNKVGGEFQLNYASASVSTTADNLIRADYSFLSSLNLHSGAIMPACYFDLASIILASMGNVSFLALMDRIPVYVVDSLFMQENFEKDDNRWECPRILKKLLHLLEEMLNIFQNNETAEKLSDILYEMRILVGKLHKFNEYGFLFRKIEEFLNSIEKSIKEYGIPTTIRNNNFEQWLRRMFDEFPEIAVSTECLGVYCSDWKRNEFHEKAIFICWERIRDYADCGQDIDLLTKVTIHEFCHAYMDVITGSGRSSEDVYRWMEESMANVLTLKVIENYTIKHPSAIQFLKYAKSFMFKQPDAYASAVRMWENGICDYDLWAWNKDKCVVAPSVNSWYKEMSRSWKTITNDRMWELWKYIKQDLLGNL